MKGSMINEYQAKHQGRQDLRSTEAIPLLNVLTRDAPATFYDPAAVLIFSLIANVPFQPPKCNACVPHRHKLGYANSEAGQFLIIRACCSM